MWRTADQTSIIAMPAMPMTPPTSNSRNSAPEEPDHRAVEERDVADAQQQAQFGGSETPEGEVEGADRVGGEVDLDGKQEIADQQARARLEGSCSRRARARPSGRRCRWRRVM